MKNSFISILLKSFVALAVVGLILFPAASFARADDTTNAVVAPAQNSASLKLDADTNSSGQTDYFGLPKEAFDRLSPQQIVALTMAKADARRVDYNGITRVIVPVTVFTTIFGCVALGVVLRLRHTRLLHETLRLMIEKGQPIPPELLQPPERARRPRNDLRTGLLFIGVGLALGIWFLTQHDKERPWPMALIPLFIGIAYLIAHKLERKDQSK
jgi:hypothetical protein